MKIISFILMIQINSAAIFQLKNPSDPSQCLLITQQKFEFKNCGDDTKI